MATNMAPSEYQKLAGRTECDQRRALARMAYLSMSETRERSDEGIQHIRVNHGIVGLVGEVGELAALLERIVYYGQDVPRDEFREEVGDCLWYIALLCNALGLDLGDVMEANIAKLKVRYPNLYSDHRARDENRGRDSERVAMDGYAAGLRERTDHCTQPLPPHLDNPLANPAGLSEGD